MTGASFKDYLMLHLTVLIWGFTAILGLLIVIPAVEIVFYRTLLASVMLGVIFMIQGRHVKMPVKELGKVIGTGMLIGLHWILFFGAARVSTASVCLAGVATCSLWTAFIEPWVNHSKIKWYEVMLGIMVLVGLYVIFRFEVQHWKGLAMAIGAAFLGACFTVSNGQLTKKHAAYVITFYEMIGACLFSLLFMPIYVQFWAGEEGLQLVPAPMDWFWLLLLGGVCTVYAFSVSVELMRRLSVFVINLTVNLEPVYGIILAVLIFGDQEKMTPGFYMGTLIILASVIMYPVFNFLYRRKKNKQLLRMQ
ncbi:DMT family transporter [Echinicola vietnamensis]|uniref:Putative permease n=1 Tax=Echinicola vietnamensis (strain DSM 17526 / LMG 23754 / KMM 6221) TaxID=926556 RepID=L0FZ22_ECHVK|nr:DMT family transporter [Echinicola vietnamensis]AGA78303.1 putative permease [Echinicola vietnamensis DSM 17526]